MLEKSASGYLNSNEKRRCRPSKMTTDKKAYHPKTDDMPVIYSYHAHGAIQHQACERPLRTKVIRSITLAGNFRMVSPLGLLRYSVDWKFQQ